MKAERKDTDVLIIGGGSAGMSAALEANARGADVLMVVKGKMGRSGATPLASCLAGAAPVWGPYALLTACKRLYAKLRSVLPLPVPQTYDDAMRKMLEFHYWLVDQDYFLDYGLWVSKRFYPALESTGLHVRRDETGTPVLPPGDFGYYILHSHGMTGYQYGESRRKQVLQAGIQIHEEAMAFTLLKDAGGGISGAMVYDYRYGRLYQVRAKTTILATGHTNWLSKRATGTREMAANGLAMAVNAGAALHNLEIQWFHASDQAEPESWMRLHNYPNPLTGTDHRASMVNGQGYRYMRIEDYDTVMPYTIQMKKLYQQVQEGNATWEDGNYTDYQLVEPHALQAYQYHWEFYEKLGMDMSTDRFKSVPTWHMSAGGVKADVTTMRTDVEHLYIAGAVGGHMLGALTLAAYDGELAGRHASQEARSRAIPEVDHDAVEAAEVRIASLLDGDARAKNSSPASPIEIKRKIRKTVWNNMMYAKTATGLEQALEELAEIRDHWLPRLTLRSSTRRYNTDLMDALDLEDMLNVCEMSAHASLRREESRGPHFREDFPYTDNDNWIKEIQVRREHGEVVTRLKDIEQKYLQPTPGRIDYLNEPLA